MFQPKLSEGHQIQHFITSNHSLILSLFRYYVLEIWLSLIMQFAHFVRETINFSSKKQNTIVKNILKHIKKIKFFLPQRHCTVFLYSGCLNRKHYHLFFYNFTKIYEIAKRPTNSAIPPGNFEMPSHLN